MNQKSITVVIDDWHDKLIKWAVENRPGLVEIVLKENRGKPVPHPKSSAEKTSEKATC